MNNTRFTRAFTGLAAIGLAAVVAIAGAASVSLNAHTRDDAKPAAKAASGEIKAEVITYTMGDKTFRGMLYVPANLAAGEKRPGVLVFHEWWGNTDYAMYRAREVAKLGYVAFAPDMYGNGRITTDPAQAGKWASELAGDAMERDVRIAAAVGELKKRADVDFTRLAAIGYCMGGTMALEAARAKDNIIAVACFHTSTLIAKDPSDTAPLKAEVLICHGEKDTFVKQKDLDDLTAALKAADRNYMLVTHPGAVHSFTNAHADAYGMKGVAYDKAADEESWKQMKALFDRTIGRK
jgi:dienelactone hydrolase